MASMCMVALEATIVSTAMPQIIADLGGLDLYTWVFSSFLLTQTAMTVVFGKLADLYGRKRVMLVGIGIFLFGSVLAGAAWSMASMVAFRLVQGVGAGAMQPVAMTIIADLFPGRERGKVQGWLASIWATSAVLGPLVGSLIIHSVSWSWVFWINIPVGIAATAGFVLFLQEENKREERSIDALGAALFTASIAALMVALTQLGNGHESQGLWAALLFILSTALFVWQERRAADPMVSFALWRRRPVAAANAAMALASMALMGLTTFLPMYVQGVMHRSPVVAGLTLTMMLLGWPAGATISARTFPVFGLRPIMVFGSAIIPVGALAFVFLDETSSPIQAGIGSLVMGFGMGLLSIACLVLVQEIVDVRQRGSATAANMFARNLGSTLGAALLGAVLNLGLGKVPDIGPVTSDRLRHILESGDGTAVVDTHLAAALGHALQGTFWAMFGLAVLIVVAAAWVPRVEVFGKPAAPAEPAA
jgi:EmrB/QacA subfamily drug resistance transporter